MPDIKLRVVLRKLLVSCLLAINLLAHGTVISPAIVSAAPNPGACTNENSAIPILPTWYKYLDMYFEDGSCKLDDGDGDRNNLNFAVAVPLVLLAVFEILLYVAGLLAVIFVTVGGFQYLTSTGEPDKAKNARTTIINALVGMMIAMLATVIVNLVGRNISR